MKAPFWPAEAEKQCLTGILFHGQLSEAQRLKTFDSVVLDATQSRQAKVPTSAVPPARTNAPIEASPGKTRAREAQAAASLLASGAFLSAMSAETRDIAQRTLDQGLSVSMAHMRKTAIHMLEHLQGEAQLAHIDNAALEEIYVPDVMEHSRISVLQEAGIPCEQHVPIRVCDVGFRMLCSAWDRPEAL